jgi:hypothetical protein
MNGSFNMKILKNIVIFLGILFALNGFLSSAYAGAGVFFSDGFESGDLRHVDSKSNARWGSSNYKSHDSVSVSKEMPRTGSYSLKFVFGSSGNGGDSWAEQRFWLGSSKKGLYVRFYMKLPSNFRVRNVKPSNNKLIRVWGGDYKGSPGKLGASFIKSNSSAPSNVILEGSRMCGERKPDYSRCDYGVLYQGFSFTNSHLNRWLCLEFHLRNDTGDGQGALQMWVDGKKVAGSSSINFNNDHRNNPNRFDQGYLLGWSNSGFDQRTVIYIDDVVFSDSYIGPKGGDSDDDGDDDKGKDDKDTIEAPRNLRVVQ